MTGGQEEEPIREYADDRLIDMEDLNGDQVILTRGQWYHHVLTVKPYMASHLDDIRRAIASPDFVTSNRDPGHPHRACLYGSYTSSKSELLLKVVVDYDRVPGFVVTAYPCSRPGSREVRIWTKAPQ